MSASKAKPISQIKIQINNDTWTCSVWRDKSYIRKFGDDSDAITEDDLLTLDFKHSKFSMVCVAHELFHAHFKYLHVESATQLSTGDLEEIIASWIGHNLFKFTTMANTIYTGLTKGAT